MQRRKKEPPLKRVACAALALALAWPLSLRAQSTDGSDGSSSSAHAFLEVGPRLTRIRGKTSTVLSVAGLAGPPGRWRAGGAGVFLLESQPVNTVPAARLRMGYGGVVVERASRSSAGESTSLAWAARILLGAGSADLTNPVTRTRITTDNFLVLEPSIAAEMAVLGRLTTGVLAGYRAVAGVELGNFSEADLRGWSIGLLLRLGPF